MEAFQFGFVEAVFKMIEDRIPGGRILTTIASVLIVLAVIVFASGYLLSTIGISATSSHLSHAAWFPSFHLPTFLSFLNWCDKCVTWENVQVGLTVMAIYWAGLLTRYILMRAVRKEVTEPLSQALINLNSRVKALEERQR